MTQDNSYQNHSPKNSYKNELKGDISSSRPLPVDRYSDMNDWQIVDFPNTKSVQSILGQGPNTTSEPMDNFISENRQSLSLEREEELLSLIRDLNECNDVLLQKVSQLEESLDRSQNALQAEIDHAQLGRPAFEGQLIPTDRNIAKLVTELELSNQSLQRHQLLNETLQTELSQSQEKASQLEHECTRLQQSHGEQSQSLLKAETDCRDLRARLQRQQRYTLQFKAALEKCLNVSADSRFHNFVAATETHTPVGNSVSMPKAEQIQPWVAEGLNSKLDPQLAAMMRQPKAAVEPPVPPVEPFYEAPISRSRVDFNQVGSKLPPAAQSKAPTDPQAEDQLWQDLARVIDTSDSQTLETPSPLEAQHPSEPDLVSKVNASQTSSAHQFTAHFTEPSPWGNTPSEPTVVSKPTVSVEVRTTAQEVAAAVAQQATTRKNIDHEAYVPAMTMQEGDPSPRVSPLKPQRKIKSLAAVDLPSFPRLKKQA